MHIEEGGEPMGVVLKAFARDRDVEASIRKIDFMTGAHQVYAGSFAEVRADVFAVGQNLPDRAVNIVRTPSRMLTFGRCRFTKYSPTNETNLS
jgi:hypothetical protein